MSDFARPKILLSRCLGVSPVRFNGGIINDEFVERIKRFADYTDICAEVDIGLVVPRPRMIIRKTGSEFRFVEYESGKDFTESIIRYCNRISGLSEEYDGAILKAKPPSCGIDNANFYNERNNKGKTDGFLGRSLKALPNFPLSDEGRLRDEGLRYRFLVSVFSLADLRFSRIKSSGDLVDFHTRYKYLLMTFSPKNLKILGNIVAGGDIPVREKVLQYKVYFSEAFSKTASVKRHYNTILHIFGYFSKRLRPSERTNFIRLTENYLKGKKPLSVVVELLRGYALRFENDYLLRQRYLNPYPEELDN